jgi:hypothetical protein
VLNVLYWFCVDSNFEILDLANDDPHHTVPQQIGVSKTKIVGLLLLLPFYFLEFFKTNFIEEQLIVNLVLVLALTFYYFLPMKKIQLLYFLWVESIPIFWWLMVFFFDKTEALLGSEIKIHCDL